MARRPGPRPRSRHDAAELPEVGLQAAATNLSAMLLRPKLMRELLANPEKYAKLIQLQCRLAREIQALQKNRDDAGSSLNLGPECNHERVKREREKYVEEVREIFSSKHGEGPNDRSTPHRNYLAKELEPIKPLPEFPLVNMLQDHLRKQVEACVQAAITPSKPAAA